jgi:hypothetical protein
VSSEFSTPPSRLILGLHPRSHLTVAIFDSSFAETLQIGKKLLHEVHARLRSVLQLHKDERQARSDPSTASHFVRGDKVTVVTKDLFLRCQPYLKLRDRQLGPFAIEEHIGKHIYERKLRATVRPNKLFTSTTNDMLYNFSSACCPSDYPKR